MNSNRDKSDRYIKLAQKLIKQNEKEKALKYLSKAERLCPSKEAKELFDMITIECNVNSFTNRANYNSSNGCEAEQDYYTEEIKTNCHKNENLNNSYSNCINKSSHSNSYSNREYTDEQLSAVNKIKRCNDYYEMLGISQGTVDTDMKKQYRKLALKVHPDKNHAPGAALAFNAIVNAFAVLRDPKKRKHYDMYVMPRKLDFADLKVWR